MHAMNTPGGKNDYKRIFTSRDLYRALLHALRAMRRLSSNQAKIRVDPLFIERIMLAVTEVNGCTMCSYAHTRMALRQGMESEEIASFLNGDSQHILPHEAKGILFAQHYAETKGIPDPETFKTIVTEYGLEQAHTILSATQVIFAGNVYGIPSSAFISRLQGKPYPHSSLRYELSMLLLGVVFIPVAVLHAILLSLARRPNVRFSTAGD